MSFYFHGAKFILDFTDKKYFETVLYAYLKENFDIKLIFEKTLIKTKDILLH